MDVIRCTDENTKDLVGAASLNNRGSKSPSEMMGFFMPCIYWAEPICKPTYQFTNTMVKVSKKDPLVATFLVVYGLC